MSGKLKPQTFDALEMIEEICARADHLGISLAMFPVPEIRELTAALRRAALAAHEEK